MTLSQISERTTLNNVTHLCWGILFIALVSGCSPARTMPMDMMVTPTTYSVFTDYRLVSGDVLDINYFFDLSAAEYRIAAGDRLLILFPGANSARSEQIVRPDGAITLPSVGDLFIAGRTPAEASALIRAKVKHLLRFPDAIIQVLQSKSSLENAVVTSARGSAKQYVIRPDGLLTLPAIGSVAARGKSIEALTKEVNTQYQHQWPTARVDINLMESQGLQVYVLGEVGRPGNYKITGPALLPQALSMAGGTTREAAGSVVYIARLENDVYEVSRITLNSDYTDVRTQKLPVVAPNDIIFVPRSTLSDLAQIMQEVTSIFMFRGWGITLNYSIKDENDYKVDFPL